MKKRMKKLRLAKETLRHLSSGDLRAAVGASQTQNPSECTNSCLCTRFCETDLCDLTCNCASSPECEACTDYCTG